MVIKLLAQFDAKKRPNYFEKFNQLVESSRLTSERIEELSKKKAIIGHLLKHICNYSKSVTLERLCEPIDILSQSGLRVEHLNGHYGLHIGKNQLNQIEISQDQNVGLTYDYFLAYGNNDGWVEVSRDFRLATYKLLPTFYLKNKFKALRESKKV